MAIFGGIFTLTAIYMIGSKEKEVKRIPMFPKLCYLLMGVLLTFFGVEPYL